MAARSLPLALFSIDCFNAEHISLTDRVLVYDGQIPLATNILQGELNAMVSIARLSQDIFGAGPAAVGLPCTPGGGLSVSIGAGSLYTQDAIDATAYSDLGTNSTVILKQGILLTPQTLNVSAPGTAGFSQVFLIEAQYADEDTGSTVLAYYNSANVNSPLSGPGGSGQAQPTLRQCVINLAVKAGIAATTGTQVAPAPDAGYVGLYAVTIANGQTSVVTGNIAVAAGAPFVTATIANALTQAAADARYVRLTNIFPRTAQEIAAGVTPTNYSYQTGYIVRYGASTAATDNTAALNLANSVGIPLIVPPGTYKTTGSPTLTSPLIFMGGILQPASSTTIKVNAPIQCAKQQIFDCSLGGTITGKFSIAGGVFPEHFGALANTKAGVEATVIGNVLTDPYQTFTTADVGKSIVIKAPRSSAFASFIGTIIGVTAHTATLSSVPAFATTASFTGSTSGSSTTLTISGVSSGTVCPLSTITSGGTGAIEYQTSGTAGGAGTYIMSTAQSIAGGTAMTTSLITSYYYGNDDTVAVNAASAAVGQISNQSGYTAGYDALTLVAELAFSGSSIYFISSQVLIGQSGNAQVCRGVGGTATIAFAIAYASIDCIVAGGGLGTAAIYDMYFDGCFTGRDLLVLNGFQSPKLHNVSLYFSERDALSIAPASGSFIQQLDVRNLVTNVSGRHSVYVNPGLYAVFVGSTSGSSTTLSVASITSGAIQVGATFGSGATGTIVSQLSGTPGGVGTYQMSVAQSIGASTTIVAGFPSPFANETDFLNITLGGQSARQAGGTAFYFDYTLCDVDSWTVTNYKATAFWNGDPNYLPLGSFVSINGNLLNSVGITFINGYCEGGSASLPIGATVPSFRVGAGYSSRIIVKGGFYSNYWGLEITTNDRDGASQFVVADSATQTLCVNAQYFNYSADWVFTITDGTHSDYFRATINGLPSGSAANYTVLGAILNAGGSHPSYTINCSIVSGSVTVSITNGSASLPLTVSYAAQTRDGVPQYYY